MNIARMAMEFIVALLALLWLVLSFSSATHAQLAVVALVCVLALYKSWSTASPKKKG